MSRFQKIATAIISIVLAFCLAVVVAFQSKEATFDDDEECTTEVITEVQTEAVTLE